MRDLNVNILQLLANVIHYQRLYVLAKGKLSFYLCSLYLHRNYQNRSYLGSMDILYVSLYRVALVRGL